MNNKGFTLVELIAVVALLGLLAILTTPAYSTVSENIKERNYNSKKSVIETQTKEYVENYLKDIAYNGTADSNTTLCFSVRFLIQNGIVTSDDEKEEYIENDLTKEQYSGTAIYIQIKYDVDTKKLKSYIKGESDFDPNKCTNNYE